MTVAGKLWSGGTSIIGAGVLPVTVSDTVGVSGSSVVMTRVQDLGPMEAGVKRMTRSLHESWLTVAGGGLLMSVKSAQAGLKAAESTARSHLPTLQTLTVFSARAPAQTSPKVVEPVTLTSPGGVLPVTWTSLGEAGSLLAMLMSADLAPSVVGASLTGTSTASPGPITRGKLIAEAARNSPLDNVMPVTERLQPPLSLSVSGRSLMSPRQTSPKLPLSAITVVS